VRCSAFRAAAIPSGSDSGPENPSRSVVLPAVATNKSYTPRCEAVKPGVPFRRLRRSPGTRTAEAVWRARRHLPGLNFRSHQVSTPTGRDLFPLCVLCPDEVPGLGARRRALHGHCSTGKGGFRHAPRSTPAGGNLFPPTGRPQRDSNRANSARPLTTRAHTRAKTSGPGHTPAAFASRWRSPARDRNELAPRGPC
jgi:hypothetical protein